MRIHMWCYMWLSGFQYIIFCGSTCWIYYKIRDYARPPFLTIYIALSYNISDYLSHSLNSGLGLFLGLMVCFIWQAACLTVVRGLIIYFRTSEGLYWYIKLFCLSTSSTWLDTFKAKTIQTSSLDLKLVFFTSNMSIRDQNKRYNLFRLWLESL